MARQPNNQLYKTVVVVWLTLSVAGVVLATITWMQLSAEWDLTRETEAIHHSAERVLRAVVDCETGVRGFVLTGQGEFLQPFQQGETDLTAELDRLVELTRRDPGVLRRVISLRAEIEVALNRLRMIVDARKERGMAAAAGIVANGKGVAMMDRIRTLAAELHGLRAELLADGGAGARARLTRASFTSSIAGVLGIGAGVFAFWLSRVTLKHQVRERELEEAKLHAERSSQEKSVFLANMSHEIRTPMNAVLGFAELLEGELREPKQRQYLQAIRTSAGSLLQLITDILDMSKIEAGVMELRLEPTDPREICDFLRTVFTEPAARKGLKLECHVAEDLPRALLLDRIRLRQIMVNLIGNAVKFTDRGNIDVRVLCEKHETGSHIALILEVQDTGVGIPEQQLEAIFQPFVQAGRSRDKEKSGTGLGLAIVRRLAEMMGGTVTAASVPGQGSAFQLRFPNVEVSSRLPLHEKLEPGREADFNQLRAATLLVVDDSEINCQLVAGLFAASHHRLVFGTNGQEAVQQARELRPDVILLDVRMPGMDGREALAEIRKIPGLELTPVIAVTASSLMNEEREATERFSAYVRKPFSKRELFDELAHFLPRQEPAATPPGPAADSGSLPSSVSRELVARLRQLLADDWPALRESLAINECKAFAARLETLARQWTCQPLLAYAQALAHHAEAYAVVDLEQQMGRFPAVVERLAESTAS
jgi:signal transduction histidine kinase/CheY-like chemotaxis protein